MAPKIPRTKDIPKDIYSNFLKRVEECFHAAQFSFDKQEWTAAAISAIHATIAGCDALCVYYLGKHSLGESHADATVLFKTIGNDEEITTNANRIARILRTKNMAEYEQRLMFKSEANRSSKIARGFWSLPKNGCRKRDFQEKAIFGGFFVKHVSGGIAKNIRRLKLIFSTGSFFKPIQNKRRNFRP